jgi:hypothetical protein
LIFVIIANVGGDTYYARAGGLWTTSVSKAEKWPTRERAERARSHWRLQGAELRVDELREEASP